jgi:hypothetical protein
MSKINAHQDAVNDIKRSFLEKFQDLSWHNDSMAVFMLPYENEDGVNRCLVTNIDYREIEKREMGYKTRFHLFQSALDEHDQYDIDDDDALVISNNDFAAL